ncbi:hypothetical protein [Novimethylophilus kurashikiensis]|uniref:hypothetical protein n=1 Tax=Novimethylophilus kurashikiensis TaxID=1825523 RepID=UPI0011B28BF6|nr:hypothetical protein [Novimethylophilus kurashikiensis]
MKLGDLMAHGREEEMNIDGVLLADVRPLTLQEATTTDWEKKCSVDYAERALHDVKSLAIQISTAMGRQIYGNNPFGAPSHGRYSAQDLGNEAGV